MRKKGAWLIRTKLCIGCLNRLPLASFNKYKQGAYGRRARCKSCQAIQRKTSANRTAKRLELESKGKRKCSKCGKTKALSSFQLAKRKGRTPTREGVCKPCVSTKQHRNHKLKNLEAKQLVIDFLKNNPCIDCGEADVLCLEFDHIHNTKKFDISNAIITNKSILLIKKELKKCVVRCSSCHRRKTHIERNTWRYQMLVKEG